MEGRSLEEKRTMARFIKRGQDVPKIVEEMIVDLKEISLYRIFQEAKDTVIVMRRDEA